MVSGRLLCRAKGNSEVILGAGKAIGSHPWGLEWPFWEALEGISGLEEVMLQILEASLWPRGPLRANISSQKQRFAEHCDVLYVFDCFLVLGGYLLRTLSSNNLKVMLFNDVRPNPWR